MRGNTPVYQIKPKYIFKSPFLKYDLQNPTNRQAQNQQLTEYFNYGFNQDTMNIYAKLVNRTLKVLDHKKNLEYFDEPSELMRLNDQIPMDFGGFCKFYDPQVFKNDFIKNDQQLFKNFLFNTFKATYINGKQYPMLEFVKSMYRHKPPQVQGQQQGNPEQQNSLPLMIDQIAKNMEKKYEETMTKLIEQKNQPKQVNPTNDKFKKGPKFEKKPRIIIEEKEPTEEKKKERKQKRSSSSSSGSGSSSSSSSSDSSSSQSDAQRRKRHKQRRQKDSRKGRDSRDKRKRKSKSRQKRGDKGESRNAIRHDDRERDRNKKIKKRSSHRSRSRDQKEHRRRK